MKNDKNKTMDSVKKVEIAYCFLLILNTIVEFFDFSKEVLLIENKPIQYTYLIFLSKHSNFFANWIMVFQKNSHCFNQSLRAVGILQMTAEFFKNFYWKYFVNKNGNSETEVFYFGVSNMHLKCNLNETCIRSS